MSKQSEKDNRRIFGPALAAGRGPSEMEIAEAMNTMLLREQLKQGKLSIKAMREQVGGVDRETTIRKMARTLAYYHCQMAVDLERGAVSVPEGFREMMAALRVASGKEDNR